MSLKARLKRLETDYQKLRFWGPIAIYAQQLELVRMVKQINEHVDKVAAAKRAAKAPVKSPLPPRKPELPHPEAARRAASRRVGNATTGSHQGAGATPR